MMKYRPFGKTGMKVSALSFGAMRLPMDEVDGKHTIRRDEAIRAIHRAFELGVNYIDTGNGYCYDQSEGLLGEALQDWRGKVYLSTKLPTWKANETADFNRFLDMQLSRLRADHLDVYYFHGISWKDYQEKLLGLKLLDEARKAKAAGRIRHVAFSVHDKPENVLRLVNEGFAEAMLCQYNLLDQRNEAAMARAAELGMGVAVMGPVGG